VAGLVVQRAESQMTAVRRPTYKRVLAGGFALLCISGVAAGMWAHQTDNRKWFYAAGGVPLALLTLRYALGEPRDPEPALREFRNQPGNLARWTVDAERWQAFMQLNERLNAQPYSGHFLPNRSIDPHGGVEVVVGESAVLIGDEIHSLDGALYARETDGPPPTLLFEWATIPAPETGSSYTPVARVPVGAGAQADAARVLAHYARIGRAKLQRWQDRAPRRRNICLAVLATSLTTLGFLLYLGGGDVERLGPVGQAIAGIAMFAAVIAFPAALLFQRTVLGERPDQNWARQGRNFCLVAGVALLVIGAAALLLRNQWKGAAQTGLLIASLVAVLGGPGALIIALALHVRFRGG
jgi:hypothetical protein